jgi:hypothetical protein
MFGGLTFMIAGSMCCGVNRDELIVRLDPRARTRRSRELTSPLAVARAESLRPK